MSGVKLNKITDAYTNIEQSKMLASFLPVESADLCYLAKDDRGRNFFGEPEIIVEPLKDSDIPCWSLSALLAVMPKELCIKVEYLYTDDEDKRWVAYSEMKSDYFHYASNPINAVIELIFELKSMALIDKFVLLTEIEKIKKETKVRLDWHFDEYTEGYMDALEKIISIIGTLEVKSIDFGKDKTK